MRKEQLKEHKGHKVLKVHWVFKELKVQHRDLKGTLVLQDLQGVKELKEPLKVLRELQVPKVCKVHKVLKGEFRVLKEL